MKKILLIVLALCLFSCGKPDAEIEQIIAETKEKPVITAPVAEEPIVYDHLKYDDGVHDWKIYSYEYTNCHHSNGYVIFTKIVKEKKSTYKIEKWEMIYTASNYIDDIHYQLKSKFNGDNEVNDVLLQTDDLFLGAFRTAEAVYLGYKATGENPVPMEAVIAAAGRMEGRQTGISR